MSFKNLYLNIHRARHKKHAMRLTASHAPSRSGHAACPLAGETGHVRLEPSQHGSDMRRMELGGEIREGSLEEVAFWLGLESRDQETF